MQHSEKHAPDARVLVVGGTGKTGRRVAERLQARGTATRAVSRSTTPRFDWDDPATWDAALEDVTAVYLTYFPDLAVSGAATAIEGFARRARARGIQRLVLLSGRGEDEARRAERIVHETNPAWTIVRASWFSQNFSEAFFLDPLRTGTLALPARDVGEPFVDADDIADVAVAALTESGHEGEIYEVTGPRLLTFAGAVDEIARASGRPIAYRRIPLEDFARGLRAHGTPEAVVQLTRYLFETVLDGRNARVADGVQRALGRPPRDFGAYARETAATGVWGPSSASHGNGSPAKGAAAHHEQVVRRFVDRFVNGGDEAVLSELVHPDYVHRSPGEEIRGRDGLAALFGAYRGAFPDLHLAVDEILSTGEATLLVFTLRGTHRGDFLGTPPTGRPVEVHGMVRTRFVDGKIAEEWEVLDQLTLFEQLGAVAVAS